MGRRSRWIVGLVVLAAALLPTGSGAATLADRARLREGPNKDSRLLGWVEPGTAVSVEGQRNGWYSVRTPDGQTGFVWQEHLHLEGSDAAAGTVQTTLPTATSAPSIAPPPVVPIATPAAIEARPPVERTDAALTAELDRLRSEIGRLATAQQELTQRIGRGSTVPVPVGSSDGSAAAAGIFFVFGVVVGLVIGRFTAGRRDRRTRIRL